MLFENIAYGPFLQNTLNLYLPDDPNGVLYIYFHGGSLVSGAKTDDEALFYALNKNNIAVASVDYRLFPNAKFPEFIEDAALAAGFIKERVIPKYQFSKEYIGGSSAGAYIAQMLFFDNRYLMKHRIDSGAYAGFVFDAGQPTTHFNVLSQMGEDSRLIRVDEAAPVYFIDRDFAACPKIKIICADSDMPGRLEQNFMLKAAMLDFGYDEKKLEFNIMRGFGHCGYTKTQEYFDLICEFLTAE